MKKYIFLFIYIFNTFCYKILSQCNFTVNAGPDIKVCNAGDMKMMAGKVVGQVKEIYWEPTTGLADPKNPTTKVTINSNMEYILTAKGYSGLNLVVNGNFESGKTGFSTDYVVGTMSCYGAGYLDCEGTYDVINNPQLGHTGFAPCKDHTSGSGLMMVLNGAPAFQNVWCQTIPVIPNMDYVFTCWVTSVVSASPPILQFNINGSSIGPPFFSSGSTCAWEKYEVVWNSGSNTAADICILNENTNTGGNDFAIDDIGFQKICEVKDTMMVEVEEIVVSILDPEIVNCDQPQIKLNAKGSSQGKNWTYLWTTSNGKIISGEKTLEPTVEGPGTYELTICSDLPGCCKKAFVEVMGNIKKPDLTVSVLDSIGCNNDSVIIFTNSSVNPLNYFWEGPKGYVSNEQHAIVHHGGTYTVTIVDEFNCKTIKSINVFESGDLPTLNILSNNINCKSDTAILIGTSSIKNSSLEWFGPKGFHVAKDSINTLDSGLYILKVTTPLACIKFDSVRIQKDKSAPLLSHHADTINCLSDSANILVFSNRKLIGTNWQSTYNFKQIDSLHILTKSPGRYQFIAMADNFCQDTLQVDILADTSKLAVRPYTDSINCTKQTALLYSGILSPLVDLKWSGPNGYLSSKDSNLVKNAGIYTLKLTGLNYCITETVIQINIDTLHPILSTQDDTLTCLQDSLQLKLSDSFKSAYSWSSNNGFISNSKNPFVHLPGDYTVMAGLPNGCQSTALIHISQDKMKPIIQSKDDTLNCKKDSSILFANADQPGALFLWKGPNNFTSTQKNPSVKSAGKYNLIVTNPNGCKDSVSINLSQDIRKPDLSIQFDTLNCKRTVATISARSTRDSILFHWTGPANFTSSDSTISTSLPGIYTIKITSPEFCETVASLEIISDTISPKIILTEDTFNCKKLSLNLSSFIQSNGVRMLQWTGPNNFVSTNPSPTISTPGRYFLTVEANNYCVQSHFVDIRIDTIRPTLIVQGDTINCLKKSITLSAIVQPINLVGSWTLPDNNFVASNQIITSNGGIYQFQVEGLNHCVSQAQLLVPVDTVQPDLLLEDEILNCKVRTVPIEAKSKTNNLNFSWSGPFNYSSTAAKNNISIPGNYFVTITAPNGCKNSSSLLVQIDTISPVIQTTADSISCKNLEATINAKTNIANPIVIWRNSTLDSISNQLVLKSKMGGSYTVQITNPINYCSSLKPVVVVEDSLLIQDVDIRTKDPVCGANFGTASILKVVGGHQQIRFSLDHGKNYFTTLQILSLAPGNYELLVEDELNCSFLKAFEIKDIPPVETDIAPELKLQLGDAGVLDLNILSDKRIIKSILWTPPTFLSCTDCEDPIVNTLRDIEYFVEVTDTNNCKSYERILVEVDDPEVWVPNVFSPNGDGINDWVYVYGSNEKVTNINTLQIFDRWGNKVYSKNNIRPNVAESGWDGLYKGEACIPGVYGYWVEVELINGKKWIVKGDVTLVR